MSKAQNAKDRAAGDAVPWTDAEAMAYYEAYKPTLEKPFTTSDDWKRYGKPIPGLAKIHWALYGSKQGWTSGPDLIKKAQAQAEANATYKDANGNLITKDQYDEQVAWSANFQKGADLKWSPAEAAAYYQANQAELAAPFSNWPWTMVGSGPESIPLKSATHYAVFGKPAGYKSGPELVLAQILTPKAPGATVSSTPAAWPSDEVSRKAMAQSYLDRAKILAVAANTPAAKSLAQKAISDFTGVLNTPGWKDYPPSELERRLTEVARANATPTVAAAPAASSTSSLVSSLISASSGSSSATPAPSASGLSSKKAVAVGVGVAAAGLALWLVLRKKS